MSKTQFTIVVAFMTVIVLGISVIIYNKITEAKVLPPEPGDICSICKRDRVTAHGSILLKNDTEHSVEIRVRHHPDASEKVLNLDPERSKIVDDILVGTLKLRFIGEGFDEESFCNIMANTQHDMWWTVHGPEMKGMKQMHKGH